MSSWGAFEAQVMEPCHRRIWWQMDILTTGRVEKWNSDWAILKHLVAGGNAESLPSWRKGVRAGVMCVRNDCDGTGMTGCQGGLEIGFHPSDLVMCTVLTRQGRSSDAPPKRDHFNMGVRVNGEWRFMDNMQYGMLTHDWLDHELYSVAFMSNPRKWYRAQFTRAGQIEEMRR